MSYSTVMLWATLGHGSSVAFGLRVISNTNGEQFPRLPQGVRVARKLLLKIFKQMSFNWEN